MMDTAARSLAACLGLVISAHSVGADTLRFSDADFALTPAFNDVQAFDFRIDLQGQLTAGTAYNNPAISSIVYSVSGRLPVATPSGFGAFNLERTIVGAEFYAQGSSLQFEIAGGADLSDGLQVSELVGGAPVFVFDGREVGTGRYHPSLFQLNSDGTGSIRNSNNMGGINPGSGEVVDVDFGVEYITDLNFDPAQTTIGVPEPSTEYLVVAGLFAIAMILTTRRRALRAAS